MEYELVEYLIGIWFVLLIGGIMCWFDCGQIEDYNWVIEG